MSVESNVTGVEVPFVAGIPAPVYFNAAALANRFGGSSCAASA